MPYTPPVEKTGEIQQRHRDATHPANQWTQDWANIKSLLTIIDNLVTERDAAVARAEAMREALAARAYAQGNDDEGWYRRCDICDAQSRLPSRDDVPHTDECPLRRAAQALDSDTEKGAG